MCLVKTIVSLLVMLMAGLQSVQSQNWVIVKERSVGVDSESLGGLEAFWGKRKKGVVLCQRDGVETRHVWPSYRKI